MSEILTNSFFLTAMYIILALIATKIVGFIFNKDKFSRQIHFKFFKNVFYVIIWVILIVFILYLFIDTEKLTTTVLASSGIAAAAIGLAAQDSFSNIMSGLFISIFKPFNIGDRIEILGDNVAGFVEDITLRHTIVRTYMNARIIVPNMVMNQAKIINTTFTKGASYKLVVQVAYESRDKRERAKEIIEEVIMNHPLFYDIRPENEVKKGKKPVNAMLSEFCESGIEYSALMWTENIIDNPIACSDCRIEILNRFDEEGIEIPYNKIVIKADNE